MRKTILLFCALLFLKSVFAQNTPNYAVELAAFDQSVPLSYFQKIKGVYETYDVNQIYRYHIAANDKDEADVILARVKKQGFPNARIIDFAYIREVCKAQCGYIPPKRTGIGAPSLNANRSSNRSIANSNNTSLSASDLLGSNAEAIPENLQDEAWLSFYEQYSDLGFDEEFLYQIYKTFGSSINIDKAAFFQFLEKNKQLGATKAELFEFFIKHGNLKISQADWFVYKNGDDPYFKNWLDFKIKNKDLGANEEELLSLYNQHGNIIVSQAIWFSFKENYKNTKVDLSIFEADKIDITNNTSVETVGFILFEFGGTQPTGKAFEELNKLVAALKKNKNLSVTLVGHADAIGDAKKNKILSLRRAKRVQQYLLQKGVAAQQTKVDGKGEENPIAINNNLDGSDNPNGRSYNRRVDLKVTDPDGNLVQIVSLVVVPKELRRRD